MSMTIYNRNSSRSTREIELFNFSALVTSAALNYSTDHAMFRNLGGAWVTKCLNTRYSLHSLLYAEYSAKFRFLYFF